MSDAMLYTPHGCVLYLDLRKANGNKVYDYSGHGNHGVVYGARLNQELPCKGLEFDGEDDYVEVPYNTILDITNDELTLEAVAFPFEARTQQLIEMSSGTGSTERKYGLYIHYTLGLGFEVQTDVGRVDKYYGEVKLKKWGHFVGVYDGELMRWYLDGVEIASYPQSGNVVSRPDQPLHVGCFKTVSWFYGLILLVRIYNRALTADEIKKCFEDVQKRILRRIVAARDVAVR